LLIHIRVLKVHLRHSTLCCSQHIDLPIGTNNYRAAESSYQHLCTITRSTAEVDARMLIKHGNPGQQISGRTRPLVSNFKY
jgi:hypothetical protein